MSGPRARRPRAPRALRWKEYDGGTWYASGDRGLYAVTSERAPNYSVRFAVDFTPRGEGVGARQVLGWAATSEKARGIAVAHNNRGQGG